ncbi:hypothetical protein EYF80_008866 [Liparis tanakae]|uniref:Uncharacterized protein n=1 Tax=Liparis tanakae TaxID=230148 RepID=A0A4Z2ISQ1_9TELE|nr:hypothetical protein EYF80_008866 [Liparis tanakae]
MSNTVTMTSREKGILSRRCPASPSFSRQSACPAPPVGACRVTLPLLVNVWSLFVIITLCGGSEGVAPAGRRVVDEDREAPQSGQHQNQDQRNLLVPQAVVQLLLQATAAVRHVQQLRGEDHGGVMGALEGRC